MFAAAPQFLPTFKSWYPRIIVSRGLAYDVERAVRSSHLARNALDGAAAHANLLGDRQHAFLDPQ
jgi:hypothetical protein